MVVVSGIKLMVVDVWVLDSELYEKKAGDCTFKHRVFSVSKFFDSFIVCHFCMTIWLWIWMWNNDTGGKCCSIGGCEVR